MRKPRQILDYGRSALLLQWEQQIDQAISQSVHTYARAAVDIEGVLEAVPAYCSLLLTFDPKRLSAYRLKELLIDLKLQVKDSRGRLHRLPVCYGGEFGPDLEELSQQLQISANRIIELHHTHEYWVYQMGYQPGFGFLGETPAALAVNRRASPRSRVAAGSVGLAGRQTGIYPLEAPGGWQLIGRCPWPMLRAEKAPFVRLQAGDRVQFFPIAASEWQAYHENPELWPV